MLHGAAKMLIASKWRWPFVHQFSTLSGHQEGQPLLQEHLVQDDDKEEMPHLLQRMQNMALSELQLAIIGYVAGFIFCKARQRLSRITCAAALIESPNI